MNNSKYLIISISIFILVSFSFLALWEKNQRQIKDGWFLYFNDIDSASPNFTIENYSLDEDFSWELFLDNTSIKNETVQVLKENKKNVIIDQPLEGHSIKIIVSHSKKNKEIYKNFD